MPPNSVKEEHQKWNKTCIDAEAGKKGGKQFGGNSVKQKRQRRAQCQGAKTRDGTRAWTDICEQRRKTDNENEVIGECKQACNDLERRMC